MARSKPCFAKINLVIKRDEPILPFIEALLHLPWSMEYWRAWYTYSLILLQGGQINQLDQWDHFIPVAGSGRGFWLELGQLRFMVTENKTNREGKRQQTKEMNPMGIQTVEFSDIHFKIIIQSIFKWIKDKQENFHKELKFLKVEIVQVLKYNQPKNTVENLMD